MYIGQEFVITDWFRIYFIENNGMAFGMELGSIWIIEYHAVKHGVNDIASRARSNQRATGYISGLDIRTFSHMTYIPYAKSHSHDTKGRSRENRK